VTLLAIFFALLFVYSLVSARVERTGLYSADFIYGGRHNRAVRPPGVSDGAG